MTQTRRASVTVVRDARDRMASSIAHRSLRTNRSRITRRFADAQDHDFRRLKQAAAYSPGFSRNSLAVVHQNPAQEGAILCVALNLRTSGRALEQAGKTEGAPNRTNRMGILEYGYTHRTNSS